MKDYNQIELTDGDINLIIHLTGIVLRNKSKDPRDSINKEKVLKLQKEMKEC